jgi:CheY-like chemotaxis protein
MMILAQMLSANEDKNLSAKQSDWAATIHSAGKDLLALINQILDLSKVEAGRVETRFETYPVRAIQEFAERTFRPVALQQRLDFRIEVHPNAPDNITTDPQLLEQVLRNLLANAFKFTEHGRVELRIGRAGNRMTFAVADTGIGIPPEHQEKIFEAFQQADSSITRKYGGTGLGLTISREYAHVLGGEIALQSTPGVGTTLTLYLPLSPPFDGTYLQPKVAAATRALPERPPEDVATIREEGNVPEMADALAGQTILVVEDDARNLYAVASLLERYKAKVIPASSAREAFAKLREVAPIGLVLMDVMMPETDGYEATREIRAMPEFARLPIVALTAKASEADRARCIAAGCSDYVVKPVDTRELVRVVVRNLRPSAEPE